MKAPTSPVIPECTACPHRKSSDICQLVPSVDEPFGLIKRRTMYQAGQFVFYEGHVALGLYILCQDRVKLTRLNRKGQQRLVDILDSGQLLEKQAFHEQPVHQVTCEVLEPSQIGLLGFFIDFQEERLIMVHRRELMIINVDRLTKIAVCPSLVEVFLLQRFLSLLSFFPVSSLASALIGFHKPCPFLIGVMDHP